MVRENCDKCNYLIDSGEESYCEFCYSDLQKNLERAEDEIANLRDEIVRLKGEITDLNDEIDKLTSKLSEVK